MCLAPSSDIALLPRFNDRSERFIRKPWNESKVQ